jgi:enolase
MKRKIKDIRAIEILDSRGNPTVKTTIMLDNGITASASCPSGASTGENEAVDLRATDPGAVHRCYSCKKLVLLSLSL